MREMSALMFSWTSMFMKPLVMQLAAIDMMPCMLWVILFCIIRMLRVDISQ